MLLCNAMPVKILIESEALKVKPSKLYLAKKTKSTKTLEELSNNSDWLILCYVAYNSNCPAEILEKLSKDSYWSVRYSVACNPICTAEILEKLSNDSDLNVRDYANKRLNKIKGSKN